MAITILKQPDTLNFSRNPVPLAVHTSESDAFFLVEVYVDTDQHYDSSFTKIATIDLTPDDDGIAYMDAADILDAELSYDVPDYSLAAGAWCRQVVKRFYFIIKEYVDSSLNQTISGSATTRHIIKGGISFEEYPTAGFFSDDYMKDEKLCMSWLTERTVLPDQKDFLFFLNHTGGQVNQMDLHAKVYFTDGSDSGDYSTSVATSDIGYEGCVFCFPAGYTQLGIATAAPAKTVSYYELWIEDHSDGSEISARYKFNVDHTYHRNARHYIYANSMGGMDSLMAIGIADKEYSIEMEEALKLTPYWYTARQGTRKNFMIRETQTIKARTGYLDEDEMEFLREFLLSEKKYEIINAHLQEILVNAKTKVSYGENDNLRALAFEYNYNFTNRVFTPETLRNITPVSAPEESSSSSSS